MLHRLPQWQLLLRQQCQLMLCHLPLLPNLHRRRAVTFQLNGTASISTRQAFEEIMGRQHKPAQSETFQLVVLLHDHLGKRKGSCGKQKTPVRVVLLHDHLGKRAGSYDRDATRRPGSISSSTSRNGTVKSSCVPMLLSLSNKRGVIRKAEELSHR